MTALNDTTIRNHRAGYGVHTEDQLLKVRAARDAVAAAGNAVSELEFLDPLVHRELVDWLSEAGSALSTIVNPAEDEVSVLLPDDWDFDRNGFVG